MMVHRITTVGAMFGIGLLLATTTAQAQVTVTVGTGLAHDCFLHAKSGVNLQEGVRTCQGALEHEALERRDRAATYDNRGIILDLQGRTQAAADDFNNAIALDPTLGDPYVNLGAMLIKNGQHEEALNQINKGLALGMSFPHIGYYNRAVAAQLLGRYKEAYYDYQKALELEPDFAAARERLKDFVVTRVPASRSES